MFKNYNSAFHTIEERSATFCMSRAKNQIYNIIAGLTFFELPKSFLLSHKFKLKIFCFTPDFVLENEVILHPML